MLRLRFAGGYFADLLKLSRKAYDGNSGGLWGLVDRPKFFVMYLDAASRKG